MVIYKLKIVSQKRFIFRCFLRFSVHLPHRCFNHVPLLLSSSFSSLLLACISLKIFRNFPLYCICKMQTFTLNFCSFCAVNLRAIWLAVSDHVVHFLSFCSVWDSSICEFSSILSVSDWLALSWLPFSFIWKLSMLILRRLKTAIWVC